MELTIKHYSELTRDELYQIFKARSDIFVAEQKCTVPEIDQTDRECYHLCLRENGELLSYLRIIPGKEDEPVIIGRVLSVKRRLGYGTMILKEAVKFSAEKLGAKNFEIHSQTYAQGLYEKAGFTCVSDEYELDGMPHVTMELKI